MIVGGSQHVICVSTAMLSVWGWFWWRVILALHVLLIFICEAESRQWKMMSILISVFEWMRTFVLSVCFCPLNSSFCFRMRFARSSYESKSWMYVFSSYPSPVLVRTLANHDQPHLLQRYFLSTRARAIHYHIVYQATSTALTTCPFCQKLSFTFKSILCLILSLNYISAAAVIVSFFNLICRLINNHQFCRVDDDPFSPSCLSNHNVHSFFSSSVAACAGSSAGFCWGSFAFSFFPYFYCGCYYFCFYSPYSFLGFSAL